MLLQNKGVFHIMHLPQSAMSSILHSLMRGVVKFAVNIGIGEPLFAETARRLYLEIAREKLEEEGQKATASQLSVTTGIYRKEVSRLLKESGPAPHRPSILGKVVTKWKSNYFDRRKRPKNLTFRGVKSDFFSLVRSVSQDANPTSVRRELERLGLVEIKGDKICLLGEVLYASGNIESGFRIIGSDIEAILENAQQNLLEEHAFPQSHFRTEFDDIYVDSIEEIKEWLFDEGAKFHENLRAYLAKHDRELSPTDLKRAAGGNVKVTLFSLSLPPKEEENEQQDVA